MYLAKDFLETCEGLVFAVVESGVEDEKVLCFLRYIKTDNVWQKVNTYVANEFLAKNHPEYLYYSVKRDAQLHAVSVDNIFKHHQPRVRLANLMSCSDDLVIADIIALTRLFYTHGIKSCDIGVTGSILIGAQKHNSDMDLVFYNRDDFHQARTIVQQMIKLGQCAELSHSDWVDSYKRRDCDLSFDEYVWHEKRKYNKAIFNSRKFDLNFVLDKPTSPANTEYKKLQTIVIQTRVLEASLAFDYPAEFGIDYDTIKSIVCFTATYTGQALQNEWIEVSGLLEQSSDGKQRIVVGSTREAKGEYIKVLRQ